MPAISDWIERWQPLLAALLTFFAACIFAAASMRMVHSQIGAASTGTARTAKSKRDLRVESDAGDGDAQDAPIDLIQSLEQIRGVVRSALSALTSSDDAAATFFSTSYASCLRLTELALETSALPPNAPQAAHRHLETLKQHIAVLRFLSKKMPASEISDALISVHSTARHLARTLHLRVETKPASEVDDRTAAPEGRSSAS